MCEFLESISLLFIPSRQDVAKRLLLELRRLAYKQDLVSRGPELLSHALSAETLTLTFSNDSLVTHAGILVGTACDINNASSYPYVGKYL